MTVLGIRVVVCVYTDNHSDSQHSHHSLRMQRAIDRQLEQAWRRSESNSETIRTRRSDCGCYLIPQRTLTVLNSILLAVQAPHTTTPGVYTSSLISCYIPSLNSVSDRISICHHRMLRWAVCSVLCTSMSRVSISKHQAGVYSEWVREREREREMSVKLHKQLGQWDSLWS